MSAILPRSHRVVRREGSIFTITENLPYLLPNFTLPARCHDMPDVHAGRVSHDRACPANNPGPLGAHVGSFAWFWPIGQTARHTHAVEPCTGPAAPPVVPFVKHLKSL